MSKPDLRRPVAGPYRQSRWAGVLELAFGWVAKGTMVLLGLGLAALAALTGDVSALADLPTTRKGWLYLLLAVAGAVGLIFAVHHYWLRPIGVYPAG
ncbi:TPA: hypothetical protein QDC20_003335 [Burkholderia aenigmatica]|uniref:hypothetical protein n=1 Tax=Burkholderia sp. AU45251 TaxID=3059204 RepID=UPI00264FC8F1|nr:hypothetical protein [Burkholderia sp. AU45251]HDR9480981.1 hypothetical protein [Burkholderia aenigmatica]MDN7514404.1 hypothetical protein [Burkholderia sp. AU45251]HDR9517497.1 hypothetical protein [Burkholderia aenigmatica]HDR9520622.1 hypothetical protein [Burkholderia aenigmatica]HDR9594364.1 hypothetical protein [Burkholderia aenigmatica]